MLDIRKDFGFILTMLLIIVYAVSAFLVVKKDNEDANKLRFMPR